jgi:tartrate-resistant acid phosphatase type 5
MRNPILTSKFAASCFCLCLTSALLAPFSWNHAASAQEINLFAVGDWGAKEDPKNADAKNQMEVITAMKDYIGRQTAGFQLSAVLLLGDNYYDDAQLSNYDLSHLDKVFEQRFTPENSGIMKPILFYIVLGNHDYERGDNSKQDLDKTRMELFYAKANSRFKFPPAEKWNPSGEAHALLPDTWYSVDFLGLQPDGTRSTEPLLTVIALDSNYDHLRTKSQTQDTWLDNQLSSLSSGKRRWVMCVAHSPAFTNGCHQSDPMSVRRHWLTTLNAHNVDFYLSGHNHDMEHLEISGSELAKLDSEFQDNEKAWSKFELRGGKWLKPTFLVAGGGGGEHTYPLRSGRYGPFSRRLFGFVHLKFTSAQATVTFICFESGKKAKDSFIADQFTRMMGGSVDLEKATKRTQGEIGNCGHMH